MHSKKYIDRIQKMNARCVVDENGDYIVEQPLTFKQFNEYQDYEIKLVHNPDCGYAYSALVKKEQVDKEVDSMHTLEESEMLIRMKDMEEHAKYPEYNQQPKRYKIVPIEDPEHDFISFDIVLEEDYNEMEKIKEKTLKKTI